jgi:hypothetical protein
MSRTLRIGDQAVASFRQIVQLLETLPANFRPGPAGLKLGFLPRAISKVNSTTPAPKRNRVPCCSCEGSILLGVDGRF